jgi:glycosyltransferase involved in cell wall biosynthesis
MKKLAIIISHPIQYYAPVFKLLTERKQIEIKVFYTNGEPCIENFDRGFDKQIKWDIPLLDGYEFEFLKNTSRRPGSHHFRGIINPDAIKRINAYNPDSILVYGWSYSSHLKILRFFNKKKQVLFRGDSHLLGPIPVWKKIARKILLSWVYRKINKALYVGAANKAYYLNFGLRENQLYFAPHAIDNERFSTSGLDKANDIRTSYGIREDDILILFAGKLDIIKKPFLLLEAVKNNDQQNVHLLFVGSGKFEKELKKRVERENIQRVYFTGFKNQTELPAYYHACDIFCLPSGPFETWGLAVNEAMAAGKAIIVSDKVGCGPDLVKENVNGHIFIYNKVNDLQRIFETICKSKDHIREMGKASSEIISRYNFLEQVNAIEQAVSEVRRPAKKMSKEMWAFVMTEEILEEVAVFGQQLFLYCQ